MDYDIAIIGGGAAGVSAALNAKILQKKFIWFGNPNLSKKLSQAELVKNYPGLPDVTGAELAWTLKNHYESMNIEPCGEVVTGVYQVEGGFSLSAGNNSYDAKTVILCLGVEAAKPVDGEERFVGRGISYCATCDGFLYKGKTIAAVCTDKRFEHEIEYLCTLASKVYVIPLYRGYEIKADNAEIILKAPVKFEGGLKLERVVFKDGFKEVDGAFLLKGAVSPAVLVHGLKTDGGHVFVNRDCSTNIAGIFAAGDCTGRPYQYVKAAGEGNVAAHSAAEYLGKIK